MNLAEALADGLRAALDRDTKGRRFKSVMGRSAGQRRRSHAFEFQDTGELVIYDVTADHGAAPEIETLPPDTVWE